MLNKNELHRMLNEDDLRDSVLLVFSIKQDLPYAISATEVTDELGLHVLCHHQWIIQVYSATGVTGCMKVWTGSWLLSRRDSMQLFYGALRRCCHVPRSEDVVIMQYQWKRREASAA